MGDMERDRTLIERNVRQGCLISCNEIRPECLTRIADHRAIEKKRRKEISENHFLLVLSQDCDIAAPNRKYIEVLAVKIKKDKRGKFERLSKPKDYNKLYLPYNGQYLECEAELISVFPKEDLEAESLNIEDNLSPKNLRILKDWRTGAYNREPFPHNFNVNFLSYLRNEDTGLERFIEENYEEIYDLLFYVNPDDQEDAPSYDVSLTAVLSNDCNPKKEEEIRSELLKHLESLNDESPLNFVQITEHWLFEQPDIFLDLVARTEDISLEDMLKLRTFNTDFLCYPDSDSEDIDES